MNTYLMFFYLYTNIKCVYPWGVRTTPHPRPDRDHAILIKNSHTYVLTLIYLSFNKNHDPIFKTS
jgi:hypothetical protein